MPASHKKENVLLCHQEKHACHKKENDHEVDEEPMHCLYRQEMQEGKEMLDEQQS